MTGRKQKIIYRDSNLFTRKVFYEQTLIPQIVKPDVTILLSSCFARFDDDHNQDEDVHLECFCAIAAGIEVRRAR